MVDTIEIEVTDIEEHPDGSATMQVEMCNRAKELMIEAGIISLLRKHIEKMEEEHDNSNN